MAKTTYPGPGASREEIAKWMGGRAAAAGLPPELPVMAGLVESGLRNLNYGDRDSLGYFQMRSSIWNKGPYAGYAQDPEKQLQWFIDTAQKANRGANLGEWVANIERPAEQYRGRYQQRLKEARSLLQGLAGNEPGGTGGALAAPPTPLGGGQTSDPMAMLRQQLLDRYTETTGTPRIKLPDRIDLTVEMDDAPAAGAAGAPGVPASQAQPSAQPPAPSQVGQALAESAKQFLGIPYSWGGGSDSGPTKGFGRGANTVGFDCSSLMKAIYSKFGIKIPRVTYDQFRAGTPIEPSQAAPGDLLFFNADERGPGHVGISLGNGQYLHAPRTGDVVKISNLADRSDLVGVRRFR